MMDVIDGIRAQQYSDAQLGWKNAYLDPESPDEAAKRLQKARLLNVPAASVDAVDPSTVANLEAAQIDWAALQVQAPQLTRRLSETRFAKLVQDDITNAGMLEHLVWKLAPEPGQKNGIWGSIRNAGARGAYSIAANLPGFGSVSKLADYQQQLAEIRDKEALILQGVSDSELFGNEQDPSGALGRRLFENNKEKEKQALGQLIQQESVTAAWAHRLMQYFPQSEAMQNLAKADTFDGAVKAFLENPLQIVLEAGTESFTQMAPALPFMAAFGATAPGMAASFLSSSGFDRAAQITEALSGMGVDLTDPDAIAAVFADPLKRNQIEEAIRDANKHAIATGAFDAASFGLAGKTLLPKRLASKLSPGGQNFANTLVQAPVQGAMGAAGEAAGQLLSKGEVENWGDVVAEFAGEFFMAPVEVASAGVKATKWAQDQEARAVQQQETVQAITETVAQSKLMARDPETAIELIQQTGKASKVEKVYIDPVALSQEGLADRVRALSPTVNEQFDEALETGSEIAVPLEEYVGKIALSEGGQELVAQIQTADVPSVARAQEDAQIIRETIEKEAAETIALNDKTFQQSLSVVSQQIKDDLKAIPEVMPDEANAVRSVITTAVSSLARDMRVSPEAAWERYGARILGEPKVKKNADGSILVTEEGYAQAEKTVTRGNYFPNLKLIARWKEGNPSTLIHESSHMFLEMRIAAMRDLLAAPGPLSRSQQRVVDIGQAILKWAGVENADAWDALPDAQRKSIHEKWARSFEAYAMEGRAPVKSLMGAFRAFKDFLKEVYTSLLAITGSVLDEDLRMLFDNIFMTSSQVRESALRQHITGLVTVEDLGLSPLEYVEYTKSLEDMYDQAETEIMKRNVRMAIRISNMRKDVLKNIRENIAGRTKEIRDEIQAEAEEGKTWKAWKFLTQGEMREGQLRRCRFLWADLEKMGLNKKEIQLLHDAKMVTKQKGRLEKEIEKHEAIPVEALATEVGYANVEEMAKDMVANYNLPEILDKQAQKQFEDENPLLASEDLIQRAADLSWYNDGRMAVLEKELGAMQKMVNQQVRSELPIFTSVAYDVVGRQKIDELQPQVYARAAQTAAKRSADAFKAGDMRGAIFFKRQEIYQSAMAKAAKEAKQDASEIKALAKKYTGKAGLKKNIAAEYLDFMRHIFVKLGLTTLKKEGLNPLEKDLILVLSGLENDDGVVFDVNGSFLSQLDSNINEAISTVEGVRRLSRLLKQVAHVGSLVNTVVKNDKKTALSIVVDALNENIETNAKTRGRKTLVNRDSRSTGSLAKAKDALLRLGFDHSRIPSLLASIEGERFGEFFDSVVAPLDKCGAKAERLKYKYTTRLAEILRPFGGFGFTTRLHTYKSLGVALTKQEVVAIMLNTGNEGNLSRLLTHHGIEGLDALTTEQVFALCTEALTAKEMQSVQACWDLFAEMQKETGAVMKRMNGREPLWVDRVPYTIMSSDGQLVEMRGGYYPIVYDKEASASGQRANEIKGAADMTSLRNESSVFAGHLKERMDDVPADRVLSLTFRGLYEGLDNQIHFVCWAEWINQTKRLLRKVEPMIRKYWGKPAVDAIDKWVEDIRTMGRKDDDMSAPFLNLMRKNVSLAGIGFNVVTASLQVLGATQTVAVIGSKWFLRGMRDYFSSPLETRKKVYEMSPTMEARGRTQFRELAEIQAQINGTASKAYEQFTRAAFSFVSYMQTQVDIPTWLGAYRKALAEGETDVRARAIADRTVIDAQGSGRLQDLSGIERGGPWAKLFTVFYTFFNTAFNVAMVSGHTKSKMKAAGDWLLILGLQPLLESVLRSVAEGVKKDEDMDDEDWWQETLTGAGRDIIGFNLGMIAYLREIDGITKAMTGGYQYTGPAGFRKFADTARFGVELKEALEEGEVDEGFLKALNSFIGVWTGLTVPAQSTRTIQGASALLEGDTDNPLVLILGYDPN